ncbi:protein roadkill-like [Musca autumnalis]|uniref:protein roadkill-like n=1 Tax=Musca autumnalis TaxID=221902 RepID=UPI003CE6CEFC
MYSRYKLNCTRGNISEIGDNTFAWKFHGDDFDETFLKDGGFVTSPTTITGRNGNVISEWKLLIVWRSAESKYNYDARVQLISANTANGLFEVLIDVKGYNITKNIPVEEKNSISLFKAPKEFLTKNEIIFKVKYVPKKIKTKEQMQLDKVTSKPKLINDFLKILVNNKYADIILVARDGTEFMAHKLVLSARSEVFDTMLHSAFVENKTNRITIDDMDADVMKEMLTFIYTGKEIPKEMALALFPAANKYALDDLETMCAGILTETINTASSVEILLLADRHSNQLLKKNAIIFINTNLKSVMKTEGWKILKDTNYDLYNEILEKALQERL